MLYFHEASGRFHDRHPRDAFYRTLVKCVLRKCTPDDSPFQQPIMRFHVTDDRSGLRKTYYYDFSEMEVVGEPTDDDRSQLAEMEETERKVAAYRRTVEQFAVSLIEQAWIKL